MKTLSSGHDNGCTDIGIELLAAVVESAKDSIIITDAELDEPGPTIVYVNAAFTEMTGYTAAEVIGKSPRFLQGPETDRKVLDNIRNTLSNNGLFHGKAVNYRKDGSSFINEWHVEPVVMEDSHTSYFLAIQHDVTERERMYQALAESEQALNRKNSELEAKNIALSELLQQMEREKQKVKDDVAANIEEVLLPSIHQLKRQGSQIDNQQLTILENNLRGLNSGYGRNLIEKGFNLSPRELEIANLIRQGIKTKQIALTLNISIETVESHRKNIRKKVGIANADDNLTNYLQTL